VTTPESRPENTVDQPAANGVEKAAEKAAELTDRVLEVLEQNVLGQRATCEVLLATYIAGGHALLEGVPGIGKTLLARVFSAALGLDLQRIQFTPDLMPTDVVGTNVFDPQTGKFRLLRGPIFTSILMADEINRTPPKTQSALLEGMQEGQATIDGERQALPEGFFVIATQNPVEFEGTYPLPEAQLDRFLTRIEMGLPPLDLELELYRRAVRDQRGFGHEALPAPVLSREEALSLRGASRYVHVADDLLQYLGRLASTLRASPRLELGVSPRGALALLETARALAIVEGRDFVLPDDFKRALVPCWEHRLILSAEAELEGHSAVRLLGELAAGVEVPK